MCSYSHGVQCLRVQLLTVKSEALQETLGPKHPDTLTSLNNLACTVDELGHAKEAGRLYQQCLETRKTVLGLSHPDTLTSMSALACNFQTECVAVRQKVMCTGKGNLALFLRANGQKLEAEALLAKVLDGRRKMFGVKHPDTIVSMNNCAAIACETRQNCVASVAGGFLLSGLASLSFSGLVSNPSSPG